jgi:gluconokinase
VHLVALERYVSLAVIIMGVSGSGKTTIGQALAQHLSWPFYDADHFHPEANVLKMSRGEPLSDTDREPWLTALHHLIAENLEHHTSLILACSALKEKYRQQLTDGHQENTQFIYLKGSLETIYARMQSRQHFMKPAMLQSQFATLEEPPEAVVVDVQKSLHDIMTTLLKEPIFQMPDVLDIER